MSSNVWIVHDCTTIIWMLLCLRVAAGLWGKQCFNPGKGPGCFHKEQHGWRSAAFAVEPGIPRAQTISNLKSEVNSSGVPTNTSARNVNRRLMPPRRLPPRSSSRAMNVQQLKQGETRNRVPMLGNQMTMCDDATKKWTSHTASRSARQFDYVASLQVFNSHSTTSAELSTQALWLSPRFSWLLVWQ